MLTLLWIAEHETPLEAGLIQAVVRDHQVGQQPGTRDDDKNRPHEASSPAPEPPRCLRERRYRHERQHHAFDYVARFEIWRISSGE